MVIAIKPPHFNGNHYPMALQSLVRRYALNFFGGQAGRQYFIQMFEAYICQIRIKM